MPTNDDYITRSSTVVVHILDGDEVKIRHFDSMISIDTDMTLELRGKKKYLEIEATTLEEAYSKLIAHLTERATTAERKIEEANQKSSDRELEICKLKKERAYPSELIANLTRDNEVLKSKLGDKENHIESLIRERGTLHRSIRDALDAG